MTATLLVNYNLPQAVEASFVEIVIGEIKWLLYKQPKSMITYHLQEIGKGLEFYTWNYEKIFLIGEINSKMSELWKYQWIHSAIYIISNI